MMKRMEKNRSVFKRVLCYVMLLLSLWNCCTAECNDIEAAIYQYCQSVLGYSSEELSPKQIRKNEDGSLDFSFYVKNAEPQTNGLVVGSLKPDGSLNTIIGPSPISTFSWLNTEIRRCLFNYQDIYRLKQAWEPQLDQIPTEEMEKFNRLQSINPIIDFIRHEIVLPDEKCIPYEVALQKSINIIESMNGWTPEMTKHIDKIAEVVHILPNTDHPVYQFIFALASDVAFQQNALFGKEYTDSFDQMISQMQEEEEAVFGANPPLVISVRIDAYSGEQFGDIYLETPPASSYGYTAIILWT